MLFHNLAVPGEWMAQMNVGNHEIRISGRLVRIGRLTAEKHEFLHEPQQVVNGLRTCALRIDLFTFLQEIGEVSPKYSYPMEWDNLAVLPVSTFEEWWTKQVNGKTRNMVRKAKKKGVEVREVPFDDALVQGITALYNECAVRQGKLFAHYGKDIEAVRRHAGTFLSRSIFLGAYLDDTLIGFLKLINNEARTHASVMHILSAVQERDKAPTNALIAEAVRFCATRCIPYLVYSSFAYGKKERDSLSDFKEHNGFRRVDTPRYYVPLTCAGSIAFRLGLHHRFVDRIPESLLARMRELRSAWHNRKFQSVAEVS